MGGGGGGGVTQDVGSGTIGVKKCGKWDYRGEKNVGSGTITLMWDWLFLSK